MHTLSCAFSTGLLQQQTPMVVSFLATNDQARPLWHKDDCLILWSHWCFACIAKQVELLNPFSEKQKRCWGACNLLTVVNLLCCAFFWTNCKTSSGAVRVFCSSGFFQNLFCCLKKVAVCGLFQCRLFLNRSEFWQTLLLWKHPMLHKWTVVLNVTYMETSTQLHIHACRSSG